MLTVARNRNVIQCIQNSRLFICLIAILAAVVMKAPIVGEYTVNMAPIWRHSHIRAVIAGHPCAHVQLHIGHGTNWSTHRSRTIRHVLASCVRNLQILRPQHTHHRSAILSTRLFQCVHCGHAATFATTSRTFSFRTYRT
jgi:ABC-type glucose/galactose transport system permease subunit